MSKKIRIYFILSAMIFLMLMQGLIIFFSYRRSYNHLIKNSDEILNKILNSGEDYNISGYHYFVVTLDHKNTLTNVQFFSISSSIRKHVQEYVNTAVSSSDERGFIDGYRYMIQKNNDNHSVKIAFLLRSANLSMLKNNAQSMVIFSSYGLIAVFIILIFVSKLVVWPLEESDRKQKSFITSASHALKTPLTIISSSADLLSDEVGENEWINVIKKECSNLTEMTKDLILLTKMNENPGKQTRIEFPISDVTMEILDSFNPVILSNQQTLIVNVEKDLNYCGEENSIRHLITVLLDNALKYSGKNGEIIVELKKSRNSVILNITNTSPYYSKKELAHLFDRFYRGSNTKEKGFGIGLYVAHAITANHKGKIKASMLDKNHLCISVFLH